MRELLDRVSFGALFAGLGIVYLILDVALRGPVTGLVERWDWAATVNGQPVTKSQVNLATDLFLARRGMTAGELTREELEQTRRAVLSGLIDDELVRAGTEQQGIPASDEMLEGRVKQFESRFVPGELKAALRTQDLSVPEMHAIVRNCARQQLWIEEQTRPAWAVPAEEIRAWFAFQGSRIHLPEMVRARHLFLSSVFGDVAVKEKLVPELASRLREGKATFEELCPVHSEDERTKHAGGDLGYFSRARMPLDFTGPVFALQPGEVGAPIRTTLGWHIVRVEEKKPARSASWEELRADIAAFLENGRRAEAVDAFLRQQRQEAAIRVFGPLGF